MWSEIGVFVVFAFALNTIKALQISDLSTRVVNGFEIDIEEIPYQAILRRRVSLGWTHSCGAIVIANKAVLTAAHCVYEQESTPSNLRIVVGTSFRMVGGTSYGVSRLIIHNEYSSTTLVNDIAIIVTAATISFSQSVRPIIIPEPDIVVPDGAQALVSGYGTIVYEGLASPVLLAAQVTVVAPEVCWRSYFGIASITSSMICANATNPPRDACQGDSGGPLVMNGTLIGIVSWGEGCADRTYPGVYTRVSNYSLWLQDQLRNI